MERTKPVFQDPASAEHEQRITELTTQNDELVELIQRMEAVAKADSQQALKDKTHLQARIKQLEAMYQLRVIALRQQELAHRRAENHRLWMLHNLKHCHVSMTQLNQCIDSALRPPLPDSSANLPYSQ